MIDRRAAKPSLARLDRSVRRNRIRVRQHRPPRKCFQESFLLSRLTNFRGFAAHCRCPRSGVHWPRTSTLLGENNRVRAAQRSTRPAVRIVATTTAGTCCTSVAHQCSGGYRRRSIGDRGRRRRRHLRNDQQQLSCPSTRSRTQHINNPRTHRHRR